MALRKAILAPWFKTSQHLTEMFEREPGLAYRR